MEALQTVNKEVWFPLQATDLYSPNSFHLGASKAWSICYN